MEATEHSAHVTEQARLRIDECRAAIEAARAWAMTCSDVAAEGPLDELRAISHDRLTKVAEMERSFLANLTRLVTSWSAHDGAITLYTDIAPLSFYWTHERSEYHGGLIYHPSYANGNERLPVGTWSVHT